MNALATLAPMAPGSAGLRLFELAGDAYAPALRGGDLLMVAPTDRFAYDGEYLLDFGHGESAYRAQSDFAGHVRICRPNPKYGDDLLTQEAFNEAVTAIVVAEIRVKDPGLIRRAYAGQVAA